MFRAMLKRFTSSGEVAPPLTSAMKLANDTLNTDMEMWDRVRTTQLPLRRDGPQPSLPESDEERTDFPLADGLLDYFPNALAEVARLSKLTNDKHHPGERLHWERGKSTDHRNKLMRHLVDSGKKDSAGLRHTSAVAWRALALLQEELEAEFDYPKPRNVVQ